MRDTPAEQREVKRASERGSEQAPSAVDPRTTRAGGHVTAPGEGPTAAVGNNSPLQRVLDGFARNDGLPTVGHTLAKLAQLTHSESEAVQELTNLILADVSLTQKLLKLANTVPYRMGPVAVTTVTRAIMLLGFNQVRTTAMSVVLLDGVLGKSAATCRADFHDTLLAGSLAREIVGSGSEIAEEASIAAMFRNLGRLLVAVYAPAEYARIRACRDALGLNAIAKRELGKSFDELTEVALSGWNLPERIRLAVQPLPPRIGTPDGASGWVRVVAQFSDDAARLFSAHGATASAGHAATAAVPSDTQVQALLDKYGEALALDRVKFASFVATAVARTREMEEAFGLTPIAVPSLSAEAALPAEAELAPMTTTPVVPDVVRDAVGRPANAREILLSGLTEASESLAQGLQGGNDLNSVIRVVVEAMFRGLGYARTAFLLRDPAANVFRTRAAFGDPPLKLTFSAQYAPDLVQAALAHATDLHIADCETEKIKSRMPAWFAREMPTTRSFLLLPLVVNQKPLGLFLADRPVVDPVGLSSDELNLVRSLRNQVILAIKSR